MGNSGNILLSVTDNTVTKRFEAGWKGHRLWIDYEQEAGVYSLIHTEVPEGIPLEQELTDALIRQCWEMIARQGGRVIPICPLTRVFSQRNPKSRAVLFHFAELNPAAGRHHEPREEGL